MDGVNLPGEVAGEVIYGTAAPSAPAKGEPEIFWLCSQHHFTPRASRFSTADFPPFLFFFLNFRLNVYFAKRAARDLGINCYRHTPGRVAGEFLQLQEFFVCFLYLRHKVQDNRTKACTRWTQNKPQLGEEPWCLLRRRRRKDGEQPSPVTFNKARIFLALQGTRIF